MPPQSYARGLRYTHAMWVFTLIVGLAFPRLTAIVLYFFTTWFQGVFATVLWPILGFIFMPYTMLWYSAVMNWYAGEWQFLHIALLIVAIFLDLSSSASSARR